MRFTAEIVKEKVKSLILPIAVKKTTLFQKIEDFRPIVSASQPLTIFEFFII
jgi:hypothetical protein